MGGCSSKAKGDTTTGDPPKTESSDPLPTERDAVSDNNPGGNASAEQPPEWDEAFPVPEPTPEMVVWTLVAKMDTLDLGTPQGLVQGFDVARKLQAVGANEKALPVRRTLLCACSDLHGKTHANTLTAKNNLAGLLVTLGEKVEAVELVTEVVAGYAAQLGATHPYTLVAKENLAMLTSSEFIESPITEESPSAEGGEKELLMATDADPPDATPLHETDATVQTTDNCATTDWNWLSYICAPAGDEGILPRDEEIVRKNTETEYDDTIVDHSDEAR